MVLDEVQVGELDTYPMRLQDAATVCKGRVGAAGEEPGEAAGRQNGGPSRDRKGLLALPRERPRHTLSVPQKAVQP